MKYGIITLAALFALTFLGTSQTEAGSGGSVKVSYHSDNFSVGVGYRSHRSHHYGYHHNRYNHQTRYHRHGHYGGYVVVRPRVVYYPQRHYSRTTCTTVYNRGYYHRPTYHYSNGHYNHHGYSTSTSYTRPAAVYTAHRGTAAVYCPGY